MRRVADLRSPNYDEMYALYAPSHDIERASFEEKTNRKFSELFVIRRAGSGRLVGFIGARLDDVTLSSGEVVRALYMGQAMLEPSVRGGPLSALGPLYFMARTALTLPPRRAFLWQDCVTVQTFMLVARHAATYYPHPRLPMPSDVAELRTILGTANYGDAYDPIHGIVLKAARLVIEAPIRPEKLADEHVRFYAESNPGHVNGDGLLQLTPITVAGCVYSAFRAVLRMSRSISPNRSRTG